VKLLYLHNTALDSKKANVIQVINMCQAFAQLGLDVTLALPKPKEQNTPTSDSYTTQLGQKPEFKVLEFTKHTFLNRFQILGNYFSARSILKSVNADLLFVRDPLLFYLGLQNDFPTIFEAHNITLHDNKYFSRFWERLLFSQISNLNFIKFITISQALANKWKEKGITEERLLILHGGFDPKIFGNLKTFEEARREIGIPISKKVITYAGSLYQDRGIERILLLAKEFKDVIFLVVGGRDNERNSYVLSSKKQGLTNIHWIGHVPHAEVANYLQAADVLLMLWTWEVKTIEFCSPMKMFEYMASEKPIVGEAYPTIKEVLVDEETAYLAQPGSLESLKEKLEQALNSDQKSKEIAIKSRKTALEKFTWHQRAKKILESIKGLI
jgi:glycosyltransferase involved in cell wall biosynthesis